MSDPFSAQASPRSATPSLSARLMVAALIAIVASLYYWWGVKHADPGFYGDYVQHWIGAHAVLRGENPADAVSQAGWPFPLYYPLPTELIAIAFAWLPYVPSECLFVGVGAGVLALGMTRHRWWGLLVFLTPSFFHAYYFSQWSPLLTGAMLLPALGGLLVAKPSTGLAMFFSQPSWKGATGAAVLIAISFLVRPEWVGEWRGALSGPLTSIPPLVRPGGFLLLLALPFWRRADARLLIGLAVVPYRTVLYETVPLFTIPQTFRQMASLVLLSACAVAVPSLDPNLAIRSETTRLADRWPVLLACLYLPALLMMLWNVRRSSPSESPSPETRT